MGRNIKSRSKSPGCVIGCLGLLTPRLIIVLLWLFSNYLGEAYDTAIWPILGFIFMPITALGYAVADNELANQSLLFWIVMAIAIALDLGLVGSGSWGFGKGRG